MWHCGGRNLVRYEQHVLYSTYKLRIARVEVGYSYIGDELVWAASSEHIELELYDDYKHLLLSVSVSVLQLLQRLCQSAPPTCCWCCYWLAVIQRISATPRHADQHHRPTDRPTDQASQTVLIIENTVQECDADTAVTRSSSWSTSHIPGSIRLAWDMTYYRPYTCSWL